MLKNALDQVTFIPVDLMNAEHRSDAFLVKNPNAGVPLLELDDGTFISECSAIIEYIDHQFAGPSLTENSPKEHIVISMVQRRAESIILDAIATYLDHATDALDPTFETYNNKEWGQKQKDKAMFGLAYFDIFLGETEFVARNTFTVADITLHAGLVFAGFAQINASEKLTNLKAWQTRLASRPSIQ
jgi:glutathione S-transferase